MRIFALILLLGIGCALPTLAQDTPVITRDTPPDPNTVHLVPVAEDFRRPLYVTHAGDGSGRLFVVEQGGFVWIIEDGERFDTPFLDISDLISPEAASGSGYSERGLLGLAFDPNYATNGYFFVNYTDHDGTTQVIRYSVSTNNPNIADPDSAVQFLWQEQPYPNHNGGHMAFGLDGYLYIGLGDGGSRGDPLEAGQDLSTWLGKILRLDVSGDVYAVPEDNPFVGQDGAKPEIWAFGLRNPWRFSFDRATGDLYIGDVGQGQWEEVNYQVANSGGGENYGWNIYEGNHPYSGAAVPANIILPVAEYDHGQGISVSAGYVYRGELMPNMQGVFFYGDFGSGRIWALWRDAGQNWRSMIFISNAPHTISSFGEDEAGELFLVDYNGSILRFEPTT
jgi:glucose/arabinose dehydrogenase